MGLIKRVVLGAAELAAQHHDVEAAGKARQREGSGGGTAVGARAVGQAGLGQR